MVLSNKQKEELSVGLLKQAHENGGARCEASSAFFFLGVAASLTLDPRVSCFRCA